MRIPTIALLVLLASCLKAPPAPAPQRLAVNKPPAEVAQIAARELTSAGFELTTSDPTSGTVVGQRARTPEVQGDDVACKFQKGSIHHRRGETTLIVTVNARPAATGSEVQVTSIARTDLSRVPAPFAKSGTNDTDCVSSGAIEKRIADALH